jgi:hypothetical protein
LSGVFFRGVAEACSIGGVYEVMGTGQRYYAPPARSRKPAASTLVAGVTLFAVRTT